MNFPKANDRHWLTYWSWLLMLTGCHERDVAEWEPAPGVSRQLWQWHSCRGSCNQETWSHWNWYHGKLVDNVRFSCELPGSWSKDVCPLKKLVVKAQNWYWCVLFQAYEERIKAIVQVADELQRENFHESDRIQQRFVQQFCLHLMLGVTMYICGTRTL